MLKTKFFMPGDDLTDAFLVRDIVFTKEQGFTIPDVDEYDALAVHVVLYEGAQPVATARAFSEADGLWHIGRVCVVKEQRKNHLGQKLMELMETYAINHGAQKILLGAQLYAIPFYEKCGYQKTGDRFFEEFCEHETLVKDLYDPAPRLAQLQKWSAE